MSWQRVVSWVLAIAPAAFFGYLGTIQLAHLEPRILIDVQMHLDQVAVEATQAVAGATETMPSVAAKLAQVGEIATTLRTLRTQVGQVPPGTEPNDRLRARIDTTNATLTDLVTEALKGVPDIQGAVLTDAAGVVTWSNSPRFAVGAKLGGEAAAEAGETGGANDSPTPSTASPGTLPCVVAAIAGDAAKTTLVSQGVLYAVGSAPIIAKNKVTGTVLVERKLTQLLSEHSRNVALVSDGAIIAGVLPKAVDAATLRRPPANELPYLVAPVPIRPRLFNWVDVPVGPLGIDAHRIGIFGRRFSVPVAPQAWGIAVEDASQSFASLADGQVAVLFCAAVIGLLALLACELARGGLLSSARRMADALGRSQQGMADDQPLDVKKIVPELQRLARLVAKAVAIPFADVSPVPPSLDDVIGAAASPALSSGDGEFSSLSMPPSGAKASAADVAATPPPTPFVADGAGEDGYESIAGMADSVLSNAEPAASGQSESLPEPPEALAAVDQLAGGEGQISGDSPASVEATPSPHAALPASSEDLATPNEVEKAAPAEKITQTDKADAVAKTEAVGKAEPTLKTEAPGKAEDPETVFRAVFQQFVATREKCGESVADLVFEGFAAKLGHTRDSVIAKHQCRDVRFDVYVKDGRAALRATPVR